MEAYLAAKLDCSSACCSRARAPSSTPTAPSPRQSISACAARGLRLFTTGAKGDRISSCSPRSRRAPRRASKSVTKAQSSISRCRSLARSRSRTRWSPPGFASRPAAPPSASSQRCEGSRARRAASNCVGARRGAPVFVDYAHKPDALDKALRTLRPYAAGQARRRFRLRRRPRRRQTADHGRNRRETRRCRHRHRRQSALGGRRRHPPRHPRRGVSRRGRSRPRNRRPRARHQRGRLRALAQAMSFSSPAKAMKRARSSAMPSCRFRIATARSAALQAAAVEDDAE